MGTHSFRFNRPKLIDIVAAAEELHNQLTAFRKQYPNSYLHHDVIGAWGALERMLRRFHSHEALKMDLDKEEEDEDDAF